MSVSKVTVKFFMIQRKEMSVTRKGSVKMSSSLSEVCVLVSSRKEVFVTDKGRNGRKSQPNETSLFESEFRKK